MTSLGRRLLHKTFRELQEAGFRIAYGDTDSCYAIGNKDALLPTSVRISPAIGDWKYDLPGAKVTCFTTIAPKSYHIVYVIDGQEKNVIKSKGLSLSEKTANQAVISGYHELFESMVRRQNSEIRVPCQSRLNTSKTLTEVTESNSSKALRSLTYSKRIVKHVISANGGLEWQTVPYGWMKTQNITNYSKLPLEI